MSLMPPLMASRQGMFHRDAQLVWDLWFFIPHCYQTLMRDSNQCHTLEREIMESCTGRGFMQQETPKYGPVIYPALFRAGRNAQKPGLSSMTSSLNRSTEKEFLCFFPVQISSPRCGNIPCKCCIPLCLHRSIDIFQLWMQSPCSISIQEG